MKNLLFQLSLAISLIACSKKEPAAQTPPNEAIPVRVLNLEKSEITEAISASGTFTTQDETLLSFKVGGIISKIFVQEGDMVKKGQVLAILDPTEVQAGFNQAKIAVEKAERDFQRSKNLFRDSVATLEQFQNAETALNIAREKLVAAQFNFSRTEIRSTKNGRVLRKFVQAGQQVGPGAPVIQINGADQGNWVLEVTLSEYEWSLVNQGDRAEIFIENQADHLPAKLIRLSPGADPQTGTYWADLVFDKPNDLRMASNRFGRAVIFPTTSVEGWEIPYEALLDADGSSGFVFVTSEDQTAKKIPVRLGAIRTETVQVIAGLENQSQLIISGSAYLRDGAKINLLKP